MNVYNNAPAEQMPKEIEIIREKLAPLMDDVDALEKTVTEATNVEQLPEGFQLSPLRDRIHDLLNALDARQKEATAKLALERAASKTAILIGQAKKCLRRAENSFKDSRSSSLSYADALQQLDKCDAQLDELSSVAELQSNDAQTIALRNNVNEQSREVAEEAATLRTAINDGLEALNRYVSEVDAVETQLTEPGSLAESVDPTSPESTEKLTACPAATRP
ncbi:hypothetical protein AAVH_30065 [Aphelenchoides avenae]|nr:hypothetical protein AAVH_30065 [Aphelenchus avenae]